VCAQPFIRILFALLTLQLAVGLQTSVAQAAVASSHTVAMHTGAVDGEHCPLHAKPAHKHDCCGSMGCQCQCANAPAALGMPTVGVALSAMLLLPAGDARLVRARAESHFRPPIA
jgi:hypothetical protein